MVKFDILIREITFWCTTRNGNC